MSQDKTTNQSWGGRFSEPVDAFVARFTASVDFDQRLYKHDIQGSIAHATMLAKVGVLTEAPPSQPGTWTPLADFHEVDKYW